MEHHNISYHKVSRETFSATDILIDQYLTQLDLYLDRLLWWNKRVNLVSRDISRKTVAEHIRHSLLLTAFESFIKADTIVDAGTGGGLPGIPLAIAAPNKQFILNDIVTKKSVAVKQMAQQLRLQNVTISDCAIADLEMSSSSLLVSKHAFKVKELWEMTNDKPRDTMVFYKGLGFEDELKGIEDSLWIDCFDLSNGSGFYNGKALVFIYRQGT